MPGATELYVYVNRNANENANADVDGRDVHVRRATHES